MFVEVRGEKPWVLLFWYRHCLPFFPLKMWSQTDLGPVSLFPWWWCYKHESLWVFFKMWFWGLDLGAHSCKESISIFSVWPWNSHPLASPLSAGVTDMHCLVLCVLGLQVCMTMSCVCSVEALNQHFNILGKHRSASLVMISLCGVEDYTLPFMPSRWVLYQLSPSSSPS